MTKTFWLSFCDPQKPEGDRFLGVVVVDVEQREADEALVRVQQLFPHAQADAEWIAAASSKAHREGCNPGGEMAAIELPPDDPHTTRCPRNTLLTKNVLVELDLA